MLKQLATSAAALALCAPAAALAQDDDWGYRHQQDHQEHGVFHDDADEAHELAHERGFYSRSEHRGYHQALRDVHRGFHVDHPGTRHDGYRLPSRHSQYRQGPYGYSQYGNSPYGYSQYGNSQYGNSQYGYSPYGSSQYGYSPYGGSQYGYSPYSQGGYGYSPYSGGSVTFRIGR